MRYSVYDYTRRVYDYYDGDGPSGAHAGSPPTASPIKDLGAPPERACWKLPAGAKKVGTGSLPQGRIASLDGADTFSSPTGVLVVAGLAYAAWRIFK